jgi:hypothetical protein
MTFVFFIVGVLFGAAWAFGAGKNRGAHEVKMKALKLSGDRARELMDRVARNGHRSFDAVSYMNLDIAHRSANDNLDAVEQTFKKFNEDISK